MKPPQGAAVKETTAPQTKRDKMVANRAERNCDWNKQLNAAEKE